MHISLFKRYKNLILFYCLGFFVFSGISSYITLQYLRLPFSMPEIIVLPFFFLLRRKLNSLRILGKDIVFAFGISLLLVLIGIMYGQFPVFSMLSSARSWVYLMLFFFAFSRKNIFTNADILWTALGSLSAWMIEAFYNYQNLTRLILEQNFIATYGLMLGVPIAFSSIMYRKHYSLLIIVLTILSTTIVFAGIRRLMAVVLISLLTAIYLSFRKGRIGFYRFLVTSVVALSAFIIVLPQVSTYMESSSYGMYHRVFGKTEEFIQSGELSSSDAGRQSDIISLAENFVDYTIPRGMVSVRTSTDKGAGDFNDYPLLQLFWIFGWPVAIVIVGWLLRLLHLNYRKYVRSKDETSMVSINSLFIMFILLFLEGTYIEYPYATPITGMLLGRAVLNSKTKSIVE